MTKELEVVQEAWDVVKKEVPTTVRRIGPSNANWTDRVEQSIEDYTKEMENRVFEYKKRKVNRGVNITAFDTRTPMSLD